MRIMFTFISSKEVWENVRKRGKKGRSLRELFMLDGVLNCVGTTGLISMFS